MRPFFGVGRGSCWTGGAPGIKPCESGVWCDVGPRVVRVSSGFYTADSHGRNSLKCFNSHIHHLRVGHCNTDKDKDPIVNKSIIALDS